MSPSRRQSSARSFDEWSAMGFRILKGSKSAVRRADGTPLFTPDQVIEAPVHHETGYDDDLMDLHRWSRDDLRTALGDDT